jgi:hypothetical protein
MSYNTSCCVELGGCDVEADGGASQAQPSAARRMTRPSADGAGGRRRKRICGVRKMPRGSRRRGQILVVVLRVIQ